MLVELELERRRVGVKGLPAAVGVEGRFVGVEGRFELVVVEGSLPPVGVTEEDCRVGVDGRPGLYFAAEFDDDLVGVEGLTE